jgi:hypothetical protein
MGSRKGEKAALMREMGERGAFASKLPARVGRKPPVLMTQELALEVIERFAAGETVSAICASDERFASDRSFRTFISRDEAMAAEWATAKAMHAERLMEDILDIADNDAKGPDGRVDSGAVQRDRLRCDVRHLRAAALDPARWGRKTEQTIKGDAANPLVIEDTAAAEERRIDAFMAFMARTSGPQRPRELSGFGRPEVIEHQPKPPMSEEEWAAYVKRIGSGE